MTEDAFAELHRLYNQRLVRLAIGILRDQHMAEDIAHETLLKAAAKLPDGMADPWPWLRKVARNACLDVIRRGRELPDTRAEPVTVESAEAAAQREQEMAAVKSAVDALPAPHRDSVVMAYWENLSYEEIGRRQGISKASVRDRLHYSKRLLKAKLRAFGDQPRLLPGILLPLLRSRKMWGTEALKKGIRIALVSTVSVAAVAVISAPNPSVSESEELVVPPPNMSARLKIVVEETKAPEVPIKSKAPQHQPASSNSHSLGGVPIPNGPSTNGAGSSGGVIGPISIHCDPGKTDPVTDPLCEALFR